MTSSRQFEKAEEASVGYSWLSAMNTAAALLQRALISESEIFEVFQHQISALGLQGEIALLDANPGYLSFISIAGVEHQELLPFPNSSDTGFSIPIDRVDVFSEVIREGESVFQDEIGAVFAQIIEENVSDSESGWINTLGKQPAIFVPLTDQEEIIGMLNVTGSQLTIDDLPPMKAFASYISAALSNARLVKALKEQEFTYRSVFDNLPVGIFRLSPKGKFIMANPKFLKQFHVKDFNQIEGKTINSLGLKALQARKVVLSQLEEVGELIGFVSEWVSDSGESYFFKENIKAAFSPDGRLLYYEGSVEDITDRKLTEKKLKHQLNDLMILNQVAAISAEASTLDELLKRVTDLLTKQLFREHFGFVLWNPAKQTLTLHDSYHGVPADLKGINLQPGEGIAGQVFLTGNPINVADTGMFPAYIRPGKDMGSELSVPIKTGETVFGVINAERKKTNAFTDDEKILLMTIADQLAVAFDKAKYFEAVEKQALQLSLLNKAVLNTSRVLNPDDLINLITDQIKDLFKPDSFVITLLDRNCEELEVAIAVSRGEIDEEATGKVIPMEQGGLSALVIETGEVLHVDDLENSPLIVGIKQFQTQMVGSWVGVPLISGNDVIGALAVQYLDKKIIDQEQTEFLLSMASHAAIAITNGRIFTNIQRRYEFSSRLAEISESLNRSQSLRDVITVIGESSTLLLECSAGVVYRVDKDFSLDCVWRRNLDEKTTDMLAESLAADLLIHPMPKLISDTGKELAGSVIGRELAKNNIEAISLWPLIYEGETIAVVGCMKSEPYYWQEDDQDVMVTFSRQAAVSIQNARLLKSEKNRRQEAEALYKTTKALTSTLNIDKVLDNILVELYRVVDYASATIQLIVEDVVRIVAAQGLLLSPQQIVGWEYPTSNGLIVEMRETHRPLIVADAIEDDRFSLPEAIKYVRGWIGVPLIVGDNLIGCLTIESDEVGAFDEQHAEKATAFANQAAIAIETARLFSQTQRRLEILQSIHAIDQAISRSMDLSVTFDVIIEQAVNLLHVNAVRLFTYDHDAQMYELAAERNLISPNLFTGDDFFDSEMVQKALDSRKFLCNNQFQAAEGLTRRKVASYSVAPLTTRGRVRGVIEVFHTQKFSPNEEWLDLLNTLATQAAIAIENYDLLTSLKRSNEELVSAYDRTLEGWAYALELRDRETVGHSRRVTEMTMRLARKIGITGMELANIRRGTLLHDIGKMGLPDSVLLKKGPLDPEEEQIMKTHPQLAYDMLVSIPYLRHALDIPYYHHEKWDGTGYPHGLKGDEIPLAARLFAVVDVWDAVVFDRPYREAWTRKEAIDYIREQSGIHFDPQVVEKFLEIIEHEN